MMIDSKTAAKRLLENDDIEIFCHRDPDGDTLGSAMALFHTLTDMGKRVTVSCNSPYPQNLQFLVREMPAPFTPSFKVAVDVASPNMLGDIDFRPEHIDLCIDHHPTNPDYATETLLCDYAATGEAIFDVIRDIGTAVTPESATAMFTALSADTGGFRYANTSSRTLKVAAALMDAGADFNTVRDTLFESKSKGQIFVEALAMAGIRYHANSRIAVIAISLDMIKQADIDESELEGLAAMPLQIRGVDIGITLKERNDGSVRISLRSNDFADVSSVCRKFDGGGHVRAAGCRLWADLEDAHNIIVSACEEALLPRD